MSMIQTPGPQRGTWHFQNGYLMLVNVIQAIALGVFITSLKTAQLRTDNVPFLVSEFFVIVLITHGYLAAVRDFDWQVDMWDVLIPFLVGVFECLPMAARRANTEIVRWWFLSFSFLGLVLLAAVFNAWWKGRDQVGREQLVAEGILCWVDVVFSLLAIVLDLKGRYVWGVGIAFASIQVAACVFFYMLWRWQARRQRRRPVPPPVGGVAIADDGLPTAFSVRDRNELLPITHLMSRLDPNLDVREVATGKHVNGGGIVYWGIVYFRGHLPNRRRIRIALGQAGFDFSSEM